MTKSSKKRASRKRPRAASAVVAVVGPDSVETQPTAGAAPDAVLPDVGSRAHEPSAPEPEANEAAPEPAAPKSEPVPEVTGPEQPVKTAPEGSAKPKRKSRHHRMRLPGMVVLVLLAIVLGFGVLALSGRAINLPVWAVAEVENRINKGLQGTGRNSVSVGGIVFTMDRSFVPQIGLRDVRLLRPKGEAILTLPEARIVLDPGALLHASLRVRSLAVSGVRLRAERDANGQFDFGVQTGNAAPMGTFAEVLDAADTLFSTPALAELQQITAEGVSLTLRDARADRVWQVGDGRFVLENRPDALAMEMSLSLVGGGAAPATANVTVVTQKDSSEARLTATVNDIAASDIAAQAAPLALLGVLDAQVSGQISTTISASGLIDTLDGELSIGKGALQPTPQSRPLVFDAAKLSLAYDLATQRITLREISVQSPSLRARASGQVLVPGIAAGLPDAFLAQVDVDQVMVDPAGLFTEPVRFSDGAADIRIRLNPFRVDIGQVALVEGNRRLNARGHFTAGDDGWRASVDIGLNEITHDRLLALWPLALVPNTRAWLAENVQEGLLSDVKAAIRLAPDTPPRVSLGYGFSKADVKFLRSLPPIQQGDGYANLEGNTYTMYMDQGQVTPPLGGPINMKGSVFSVLDILQSPAQAEITLKTDSTLTATLSLLDEKPFNFLTKAGRPVELGQGHAVVETLLRLPLAKKVLVDDVHYDVAGTLSDVSSDLLVPGKTLTAAALSINATPGGMVIAGPGRLGKVPFNVTYRQSFSAAEQGRGSITGTAELSPLTVSEFGIGLPDGMLSGKGTAQIKVDLAKAAAPKLTLTSDLRGVGLKLPEIGWTKAAGAKGKLALTARLGTPPAVDSISVEGGGLKATGKISLRPGGGLDTAQFSRVQMSDWLDAKVTLTGQGRNAAVGVQVNGGSMDLRRAVLGQGRGGTAAGSKMQIRLDSLRVSDSIALTGFRGTFDQSGGFGGTFTAGVNGQAAVQGRVAQSKGGTAVRLTSTDAGAVLAAAGIFPNARGGDMDLQLIPRGPAGQYDGTVTATQFRVRNTPILAELLNAISVVGALDQLANSGLLFSSADATFRLTPAAIELTQGAAVGASLGVSMAGLYEVDSKRLRMQGVISPIYLVNGIGQLVSKPGEGLFGFNYKLSGTADAPEVSVNPLSLLTPGIFREIFRRPPPVIKDAP